MCGIAGEFGFCQPVSNADIVAMREALVHRGPDDAGVFCEGAIGLGHRRLSIIDLSPAGRNPMWSHDRALAIIFNGEVYNHRDIRSTLESEGYAFRTSTDTEVIVNAVHRWGIETALGKLVGMFAFAIWDTRSQTLFLARDRAGVKPLFYSVDNERLLFASELRALYAHPRYHKAIDRHGVAQFLSFGYTLGSQTVLQHTFRVPAGHFVRVERNGQLHLQRYWSLDAIERNSFKGSFDDAADALLELATDAFRFRLVSDVPVGVFLSSGIDSTFLAAILRKRLHADLLHLTIGFRDQRFDEAPGASEIARQLGVQHHVTYLDSPDASQALRDYTEVFDEPFGDSSGIPTSLVSRTARQHVKVALSADGGDELFCGYESYPQYARRFSQVRQVPRPLRAAIAAILGAMPVGRLVSAYSRWSPANGSRAVTTFQKGLSVLSAGNVSDVLRIMNEKGWPAHQVGSMMAGAAGDFLQGSVFAQQVLGADASEMEMFDAMMRTDFQAFMGDDVLTKVDRASMATSLECRDPFLDHRLAEFAYSLPMEFHYAPGEHKRLLKHLLRRWISAPILTARKRGFSIPLQAWTRGPWRQLVTEYLTPERVARVGILNERSVAAELRQFYERPGVGAERVQLLLNFQMWAERWYLPQTA